MARRGDISTASRGLWNLEKIVWFRPAVRVKSLRIHLLGSVARLLGWARTTALSLLIDRFFQAFCIGKLNILRRVSLVSLGLASGQTQVSCADVSF